MKLRKQIAGEARFIREFLPMWFNPRWSFRAGTIARSLFLAGVAYGRRAPWFRSRIRTRAS